MSSMINTTISSNISAKVINSTNKIDIYELEYFGISNLSQVLSNDIQNITNELVYPLLQIIISSILSISISIFLLIKIPLITLIIFFVYMLLYYFFIKTSKNKIRNNSKKTAYFKAKFTQSASEIVISSRYLKNSIKSKKIIDFLKGKDKEIKKMSAQNNFLSTYPKFIAETFGLLSIAFIGLISTIYSNENIISLLAILALSIQKIIPSLQSIFVAISSINCNSANIDRIIKFIKLAEKEVYYKDRLKILERIGNVEIIKKIPEAENKIILLKLNLDALDKKEKLNFSITKNEWTGIVGRSGIGKTSLMDLITGMVIPLDDKKKYITDKGELTILNNLYNNFIYLSQFNYIPNCSLIEYITNNTYEYNLNQNIEYVSYLLKESNLFSEFNLTNEKDLFKDLSENASSISGGQAQRLNILRTIFELKNFHQNRNNILAMDEPFKGLDDKSKFNCIRLLKEVSNTAILITHSYKEADKLCNCIYKIT